MPGRAGIASAVCMLLAGCGAGDRTDGPTGSSAGPSASATPTLVTALDGVALIRTFETPTFTQFSVVADGDVWMANAEDGTVTRYDPESGQVVDTVKVGGRFPDPQAVTADPQGQVWATARSTQAVVRIDPATNKVVESITVGITAYDLAVDARSIWVTDFEASLVIRVDRSTRREIKRLSLPNPTDVLIAHGSTWVAHHRTGDVSRIDPASNTVVATVRLGGILENMTATEDSIWVAGNSLAQVQQIDPATNAVPREIDLGENVYSVSYADGVLWAAGGPATGDCHAEESFVVALDAKTGARTGRANMECVFSVLALPGRAAVARSDESAGSAAHLRLD